jgi:hypothetical protein
MFESMTRRRLGARSKVPHPGQIPILQAADIVITNLSKMLGVRYSHRRLVASARLAILVLQACRSQEAANNNITVLAQPSRLLIYTLVVCESHQGSDVASL